MSTIDPRRPPSRVTRGLMRTLILLMAVAPGLSRSLALHTQEPVAGATDPETLFHSSDPTLDTNKQAAYHIVRDLLDAGHWELADENLTERHGQHNHNAGSVRDVD